jgi:hypothetical protein
MSCRRQLVTGFFMAETQVRSKTDVKFVASNVAVRQDLFSVYYEFTVLLLLH